MDWTGRASRTWMGDLSGDFADWGFQDTIISGDVVPLRMLQNVEGMKSDVVPLGTQESGVMWFR